jgi:hypothetical protein
MSQAKQRPAAMLDEKNPVRPSIAGPPKFDNPLDERAYLKGRLAAAFRIFGKLGFDEGVAGHITCREYAHPKAPLYPTDIS